MRRTTTTDAESSAARSLLLVAIGLGVAFRVIVVVVLGTSHSPTYEFGIIGNNLSQGAGFTYFAAFPNAGVLPAVDRGNGFEPAQGGLPPVSAGSPQPSAYMPPVYPAVVAAVDEVTATDAAQIRLLQALNVVLFVVLALVVFWLGRVLLGPAVGAVAALGAAGYPPLVYMASQVSASNLYLPAQLAMLLLAIHLVRRPLSRRLAIATGLLAGLVGLLRPEGLVLVAVIALILVVAIGRDGRSRRQVLPSIAILIAVSTLLPGAWLVRNSVTFGRPTATISTQAGFLLWAGNHEGATGSGKTYTSGDDDALRGDVTVAVNVRFFVTPGTTYELRRDAVYRHEAIRWIRDHPASAAAGIARKAFLFAVVDPDDRRSLNPGYLLSWAALAFLAVAGLRRLRPRGVEWLLIAGYGAVTALVPVLLVVLPRYRLPIDIVLLVPAAWWVTQHRWFARYWSARAAERT